MRLLLDESVFCCLQAWVVWLGLGDRLKGSWELREIPRRRTIEIETPSSMMEATKVFFYGWESPTKGVSFLGRGLAVVGVVW